MILPKGQNVLGCPSLRLSWHLEHWDQGCWYTSNRAQAARQAEDYPAKVSRVPQLQNAALRLLPLLSSRPRMHFSLPGGFGTLTFPPPTRYQLLPSPLPWLYTGKSPSSALPITPPSSWLLPASHLSAITRSQLPEAVPSVFHCLFSLGTSLRFLYYFY